MLVADAGDPAFFLDRVATLLGEEDAGGAEELAEQAGASRSAKRATQTSTCSRSLGSTLPVSGNIEG